ncbi:uncharacterized protein LOC143862523 isoform X2 [Tasmannia lanceolata]|uniref:uncharacterized protein LOC143862523 isoform X2 n=1 Tax=Tasmannia lanceolata TaxID=3420 RepID=UPI004064C577
MKQVTSSVIDDTVDVGLLDNPIPIGLNGSCRLSSSNGIEKKLCSDRQRDTGNHDGIMRSSLFVASGSGMTSTSNGFNKSENPLFRKMKLADLTSKKLENNKHYAQTRHGGTMLNLDRIELDIPSSSHVSGGHLADRAKFCSDSLDISESVASDVKARCGNRGKIIDVTQKIAFNGKYDDAGTSVDRVDAIFGLKYRDYGTGINPCSNSQPKTGQNVSAMLQPVILPRKNEQRRLVRNGCISPYNIAKGKSTSENNCNSIVNGKLDGNGKGAFKNSSDRTCQILIHNPRSEGSQIDRRKGKGVMDNTVLANECNARIRSSSSRDLLIIVERSTRNRSKKTSMPSSHGVLYLSTQDNDVCNSFDRGHERNTDGPDHMTVFNANPEIDLREFGDPSPIQHAGSNAHPFQASPNIMSESDPENERQRGSQRLMKKQMKKSTSTRNRLGRCSSSTFDNTKVSSLCSSGEPSNVKPTRSYNSQHRGILGPVIEVDELHSPETRCNNPQGPGCIVSDDSSARTRQVEADEILARQLQAELYHESPAVGGSEFDANIAWTLEALLADSIRNQGLQNLRGSTIERLNRHYASQSFQSSSVRSTNYGRLAPSARMQQLRRNYHTRSLGVSSQGRNFQFPNNMDLDMRRHLLEALETTVGNSGAMATTSHFLQVQRDFNENDYEMLLALDEDNHQHVGASSNQINSLPWSTVQTDNFEEACVVCLETPSTGDIIRHLPCLHKFHKECIDPWLRRRSSCPICTSAIT